MIFQHHRFRIHNANQHPYRHNLSEFLYSSNGLPPNVNNVKAVLDYIVAVLYPNALPSVATPSALPLVGNNINDYRIVQDDGDGKAASYRFGQREGEASASWHKVGDLDFGVDSILQQWNNDTLERYVSKYGHNDLDGAGVAITGDLSGQRIYGGVTANTNLSLFANSGDGVGAGTGFIQFGDNAIPLLDATFSLGTATKQFSAIYASTSIFVGTLSLSPATITDSSGTIGFGTDDLTDINQILIGTSLTVSSGSITDSSGSIAFSGNAFTGVGSITCTDVQANTALSVFFTGTQIADLTFTNGNIASLSAAINFNALNLTTTGLITGDEVFAGDVNVAGNTISIVPLATSLLLDSTLYVTSVKKFYGLAGADFTGDVAINAGKLDVFGAGAKISTGELKLEGKEISATVGEIWIVPFTTSLTMFGTGIYPYLNNGNDIGTVSNLWKKLWLGTSIGNVANEITVNDLLTLRSTPYRDIARALPAQTGDALFWNGSQWLASAPDTEITHSSLSGLITGDSGHTQFAMLAGRVGGQYLYGGTTGAENLTLESTSNAAKGSILFRSKLATSDSVDIGGTGLAFKDVYTTGQFFGFRLENLAATPAFSPASAGRLIYNSVDEDMYLDTGLAMKRINPNRFSVDTVWDGTDTVKVVATTDVNARFAIWQLKDNTNSYEVVYCKIQATGIAEVTITVTPPLPAGSYRLTGVE